MERKKKSLMNATFFTPKAIQWKKIEEYTIHYLQSSIVNIYRWFTRVDNSFQKLRISNFVSFILWIVFICLFLLSNFQFSWDLWNVTAPLFRGSFFTLTIFCLIFNSVGSHLSWHRIRLTVTNWKDPNSRVIQQFLLFFYFNLFLSLIYTIFDCLIFLIYLILYKHFKYLCYHILYFW